MSTVYVVNEPQVRDRETGEFVRRVDFSTAEKFGTLFHILPPGPVAWSGEFTNPVRAIDRMWEALENYGPEDFILLAGDLTYCAFAVSIAAQVTDGVVNTLRWDPPGRQYVPVRVRLWDAQDQGVDIPERV